MAKDTPTNEQMALALAALQAECYVDLFDDDPTYVVCSIASNDALCDAVTANGNRPICGQTPIEALANAAKALGLQPIYCHPPSVSDNAQQKFPDRSRVRVTKINPFDDGLFDWTLHKEGTVLAFRRHPAMKPEANYMVYEVKMDCYPTPMLLTEDYLEACPPPQQDMVMVPRAKLAEISSALRGAYVAMCSGQDGAAMTHLAHASTELAATLREEAPNNV